MYKYCGIKLDVINLEKKIMITFFFEFNNHVSETMYVIYFSAVSKIILLRVCYSRYLINKISTVEEFRKSMCYS